MRNELQTIEIIEQYLNNEMNAQEKAAFETEIQNNPTLKKQLKIQELISQAVARQAIKKDILQHSPSSGFNFGKWIGIIVGVVLIAVLSWMVIEKKTNTTETPNQQNIEVVENTDSAKMLSTPSEETVVTNQNDDTVYVKPSFRSADKKEQIKKDAYDGLNTWIDPIVQTVRIDPAKGATIEGKDGTLIIVPANAFVHADGSLVTEPVTLEIIEALKVSDMVAYNLTTMNGDKTLQSGGMLYLQPYLNGEKININPERPLYIEIPTDTYNPEMKAWKGVVDEKGDIDWQNPKNLERFLTRIDFENLDFLPTGFENAVKAGLPFKSYKTANRELVDSLYYSLSITGSGSGGEIIFEDDIIGDKIIAKDKKKKKPVPVSDSIIPVCHIDPLSIKAIRTSNFANTLLATKEFEERLKVLHKIPESQSLFDLYVNNLSKNMWVIDEMVAKKLSGDNKKKFLEFAGQKLTNVKGLSIYQEQLSMYYNTKRKEFAAEIQKQKEAYENKSYLELELLRQNLRSLKTEYTATVNKEQRLNREMKSYKSVISVSPPRPVFVANSNNVYSTTWYEVGWVNIDVYLKSLSKESILVAVLPNVEDANNEGVKIYQCLNSIKTIVPLAILNNQSKSVFPARNSIEAMKMSSTYTIGLRRIKGKMMFAEKRFNPYKQNSISLQWSEVSMAELKEKLKELDYSDLLQKHIEKQEKILVELIDLAEKKKVLSQEIKVKQDKISELEKELAREDAFIQSLWNVLDVCEENSTKVESISLNSAQGSPYPKILYDGVHVWGMDSLNSFFKKNFKAPISTQNTKSQGTVLIDIKINSDGTIKSLTSLSKIGNGVEAEAKRVLMLINGGWLNSTVYSYYINSEILFTKQNNSKEDNEKWISGVSHVTNKHDITILNVWYKYSPLTYNSSKMQDFHSMETFDIYSIITENYKRPISTQGKKIDGIVSVIIKTNENGKINTIDLETSAGFGIDEEFIRLIKLIPDGWMHREIRLSIYIHLV